MANFETHILTTDDGSWERFKADWRRQCEMTDSTLEDYSPTAIELLTSIVEGTAALLGPTNVTRIAALWDTESDAYYAVCMVSRTMLPGVTGRVLRVRELTVSPLIDYGIAEVAMYPDVIIGVLSGIVHLSSTVLGAEHIHMHLRSPGDQAFFRLFGTDLGASGVFASVQTRGTWLYISKTAEVGTPVAQETN
jgi:hypothetical protein